MTRYVCCTLSQAVLYLPLHTVISLIKCFPHLLSAMWPTFMETIHCESPSFSLIIVNHQESLSFSLIIVKGPISQ